MDNIYLKTREQKTTYQNESAISEASQGDGRHQSQQIQTVGHIKIYYNTITFDIPTHMLRISKCSVIWSIADVEPRSQNMPNLNETLSISNCDHFTTHTSQQLTPKTLVKLLFYRFFSCLHTLSIFNRQ